MKRITVFLAAILLFLTGCGKETSPTDLRTDNNELSPAKELLASFISLANDSKNDSASIADKLLESDTLNFTGTAMPVEPGMLNGFKEEIKNFEKGTIFGPTIGTIPFIGYVFELQDKNDADAFRQKLKNNADTEWNVGTKADEIVCESVGNKVLFIMAPYKFDEGIEKQ